MGRPIEITDEDVIRAGNALLAENRAVNGTRLWRGVGEHGRPERLLAVWTARAEASTTVSHEPSSPIAALPEIALRLLSNCKEQLGAGLDACVRESYAVVERTLVTRFQTEMAAMTTSRESHQAELREAWQTLSDLAEKHQKTVLQEKWLGFSLQRFGFDKWIACRLIRTSCRCRGVAQGGRSPTGARPRQRRLPHAAIHCGMWSR